MSAETIIARGAMVYASALGAQTAQALAAIDRLLAMAGTMRVEIMVTAIK
jgi:hypothetical protein